MSDPPTTRTVPRPEYGEGAWDAVADRVRDLRRDPRVAVAALLLAALAAGVIWYQIGSRTAGRDTFGSSPSTRTAARSDVAGSASSPTTLRSTATTGSDGSSAPNGSTAPNGAGAEVVVDVAGDVVRPGVVHLPAGARVTDAITAAGGAKPDADLGRLNLAAKLVDGQHVAVAKVGEPAPAVPAAAGVSGDGSAAAPTPDAPLDLNAASAAQLEALPGIGPSLAQAIVTERDRSGGFRSVDDLRRVRGIGDARFAQIAPLVRV
jgi:competence protein ComEA